MLSGNRSWCVLAALVLLGSVVVPRAGRAAELPEGVPAGATAAKVVGHVDGDKFEVEIDGEPETVLLISADAPELPDDGDLGECYAAESADRLKKLLPRGKTVYLEADGEDRDSKDRLLRYAWMPREDRKAQFIDERMVADGYSTFKAREGHAERDARLKRAEDLAKNEERGLWEACGGGHVAITPVPEMGEADNPAPVGTTLNTEGQDITLSNAYFATESGFSLPKVGYVFLIFDVSIVNVDAARKDHDYGADRFSAKDLDTGAEFDDVYSLAFQPFGPGTLSPGEYSGGTVAIEVQETAQRVRISYTADRLGGDAVYWIVTR
jgi:endonuclease YncB( thermonuclease family)